MKTAFALVLLSLAAAASAQDKAGPKPAPRSKPFVQGVKNFRISFKLKSHALEAAGNFVVMEATQANYNAGGTSPVETPASSGKEAGYQKHGTVVNCLPVEDPNNGFVRAECQFELSRQGDPMETFQLQSSFEAKPGRALVLVNEPDRRVEVMIEEVAP